MIDNKCYESGATNPANSSFVCQPGTSKNNWVTVTGRPGLQVLLRIQKIMVKFLYLFSSKFLYLFSS